MKWMVFSKHKPKVECLYIVKVEVKAEEKTLFSFRNNIKDFYALPDTKGRMVARWGYKEQFSKVTKDQVIYKKFYYFWDLKGDPVTGVTHFLVIPDED